MPPSDSDFRADLGYLLRAVLAFLAAMLASTGIIFVAMKEVRFHHNVVENGLLEHLQLALLAISAIAFAVRAANEPEARKPLTLVFLATLAMCVRELDGFFDVALFHGSWALLDSFVLVAFLIVASRGFRQTVSQFAAFLTTPTCILFSTGFMLAAVVSRLIGMKENWYPFFDFLPNDVTDPLDPHSAQVVRRCVKNAIEESYELGSYLVILAGALLPPLLRRRPPKVSPRD